jgi:hypothetical protein
LYGCDTWTATLTTDRRERLFENRALRKIFEPKKEKVIGRQRNLQSEEFHDHIKGDEETAHTGKKRNACTFLV